MLTFLSCQTKNAIPKKTLEYLNEAMDLLEEKSVHRNKIDWKTFRANILKKAKQAKNIEDTYTTLSYAVSTLGDNHSYFKPVNETNTANKPLPVLSDEVTPGDIGYIRVPFCIGRQDDYVSTIRTKLKEQSRKKLKGWIIDLRGNFWGNMWPMLLSIEPLIGNGVMGYFVDANNKYQAWKLDKGKVYIDDELVMAFKFDEELDLSNQFLAILTDHKTASSGEAITVALKSRKRSKSFGNPTYGVSTGCVAHRLSDGSIINLAESVFADRTKKKYGLSITPDVIVNQTAALKAGIDWIYKMHKSAR